MNKFLCMDCHIDTSKIGEHYFIKTNIWLSVVKDNKGMLCISCLEKRLKRKLIKNDFTKCYINNPKFSGMSLRLLNRLGY
jgi:hypothetical protein